MRQHWSVRRRSGLLLVAVIAATSIAAGTRVEAVGGIPSVACARSTSTADISAFMSSGASGLIGGDYARSYPMADGRVFWTLQDSFVGPPGTSRLDGAGFVHNVAMVQNGRCFTLLTGKWDGDTPRSFVAGIAEEQGERWWWALDGAMGANGNLHVFYAEFRNKNGTGAAFGATPVALWRAEISLRTLTVVSLKKAADPSVRPMYGFSIASDDDWSYLYGSCYRQFTTPGFLGWFDLSCNTKMRVARVPRGRFDLTPSYWNGSSWSSNRASGRVILDDGILALPLQVERHAKGKWVAVAWLDDWFGQQMTLYQAPTPAGPFVPYATVPVASKCGADCTVYFASFAPGRAADGDLRVSLSNFTWDRGLAIAQPALYRPTMVDVPAPPGAATEPFVYSLDGTVEMLAAGVRGIDPAAKAITLNLTAVAPSANGFVTAWACGTGRPPTSSLTLIKGATTTNTMVVPVGVGGRVCLWSPFPVDLLAHVDGWMSPSSDFTAITPARLLDSRPGFGTVDGRSAGVGMLQPGQIVEVPIVGRGGVGATATRTLVNISATGALRNGYVTAWQCGAAPSTANLNVVVGQPVSNTAVVSLSSRGSLCLRASAPMHVIVDAQGWWGTAGELRFATAARLLDTRQGAATIDGVGSSAGPVTAAQVVRFPVVGRARIGAAEAVVLNVAATKATRNGSLIIWPCDSPRPSRAGVRFAVGTTRATLALTPVGPSGELCVSAVTPGSVEVVIDVQAWFAAVPAGYVPSPPLPVLDTR